MSNHTDKIAKKAYDNVVLQNEHNDLLFQHAVLCQVYLPYRDPGQLRSWERRQGKAFFAIRSAEVFNPVTEKFDAFLGLPFGPKARLVLSHINTVALQQQRPDIEISNTLTSFVKFCGLSASGQQIESIKNQMARLASSIISIAFSPEENRSVQVNSTIIKGYDVWFPKNPNQRVIWENNIVLSDDYFNSLMNHAVPLDARHVAALSNNALALDIYTWLAQRLHRVNVHKGEFVHWQGLKEQFGENYKDIYEFKKMFRHTLSLVKTQYVNARIDEDKNKGFNLLNSPPPVPSKLFPVTKLPDRKE